MTTMIFALMLFSNPKIGEEVNISSVYTDSVWHKIYCCTYCETIYEIVKNGNKIKITSIYKEHRNTIHGVVKNEKIYTDDPYEKGSKQAGNIYSLKGNTFRVKNLENGDYDDYILCK
jgi:hypothetical protein